jgi:alkylhydroperoxidase family enzyme
MRRIAMVRVSYVEPDSLDGPTGKLAEDPFYNVLAHRPEILEAWAHLDKVFFGATSKVANGTKEEARRTLAQGVGCALCASLGTPRPEHSDPKEALAVAFAEMLATDHRQIDEGTFEVLRQEFTDAEIVELVSWLCFKYGSNMLGALMKLAPATAQQIEGYAEFVAHG